VDAALVRLAAPTATKSPRPRTGTCRSYAGDGKDAFTRLASGQFYLQAASAPVAMRFRRFGPGFPADAQANLESGGHAVVAFAHDRSRATWYTATRSTARYVVCTTS
jgi:hypothetical protein